MSPQDPVRVLRLEIEIFDQVVAFDIQDGECLILGSDPKCNLHIEGGGIAGRHLSLAFKNETVDIVDLESDEGTYRLPQGAPFVEFKSIEDSSIELKLGKTFARIKWKIDSTSQTPALRARSLRQSESPTRIVVAENSKASAVASPQPPEKTTSIPTKKEITHANGTPVSPRVVARPKQTIVDMSIDTRLRSFENLFLLFFLAGVFRILTELREKMGVWQMWGIPDYYRRGVALDCLYLYWKEPFFWRTLAMGLIGFFLFLFLLKPLSQMAANRLGHRLSSRVLLFFSGLKGARWIGMVVSITLFFWTPFLAFDLGFQRDELPFFEKVSTHLKNTPNKYFDFEKVPAFYKGSSLLYKTWVLSERDEMVNRCRSFGLDSWSGQKQCSVLFFSKTLEGYARFQPRISQSLATSQVLIACLDGLIRVFSLEGPNSPIIYLFLDPLDRVGLSADRKRIVDFIASYEGLDFENMLKGLVGMKHRLEEQADDAAEKLPKALRVRFPGPVELGI